MALDPGVSLRLLRVTNLAPSELLLYLQRHPTLDVPTDSLLTLRIVHTCTNSPLSGNNLPPCTAAAADSAAARDASLSAQLTVTSGGTPPARPGIPWLRHLSSYERVLLLWAPPATHGSSPVRGYVWVEFIGGRPVLSGDEVCVPSMTFHDLP